MLPKESKTTMALVLDSLKEPKSVSLKGIASFSPSNADKKHLNEEVIICQQQQSSKDVKVIKDVDKIVIRFADSLDSIQSFRL